MDQTAEHSHVVGDDNLVWSDVARAYRCQVCGRLVFDEKTDTPR